MRLGLRRALARASVFWERAWPALWPAVGIAGLFLAMALVGAFSVIPGWLHGLLLMLFAGLFAHRLWVGARQIRVPTNAEATRRLETDSGLEHRPLTVIEDRPALGVVDPETERLWHLHLARATAAAMNIRLRWPRPNLANRDPYALRIALGVALVISMFAAGPDPATRVARALSPDLQGLTNAQSASLELWVTPPNYTNLPPQLLASADPRSTIAGDGPIRVPVNSLLLAQVSDARGTPTLRIADEQQDLVAASETTWRIESPLNAEGQQAIRVEQSGQTLGEWTIEVTPDHVPEIRFVESPAATESNTLQLSYESTDDHGITAVTANITWPGDPDRTGIGPVEIELPQPRPDPRDGSAVSVHDLTAHPWAGLEVDIQLTATDGRGQAGRTDRLAVFLPERTFNHPVAREIIEQRRVLALSPENRRDVARSLDGIGAVPQRFNNDIVVFLALMTARSRMIHENADHSVEPILSQLWDTALRLEDGALSLTQRRLAELQRELREAIENGASDEEIQELMAELRTALDRYLEALAQNLSQALEGMDLSSLPEAGEDLDVIDREAMEQLLQQLEQMARLGDTEGAQQLLERMQQMLQALQNAPNMLRQQQAGSPAQELLRELQDVVRRQQALRDDVFRRDQSGESFSESDAENLRNSQNEIRRQLGEMMRQLGEMMGQIPENLGNAEDAMGEAEGALESGDLQQALNDQARALAELQRGAQQMALQIIRRQGEGQGPGQQQGLAQPGEEGFDPLGRPLEPDDETSGGFQSSGRQRIGDGEQAERALEIIDELRERILDSTRPALELDYLERLLRRF